MSTAKIPEQRGLKNTAVLQEWTSLTNLVELIGVGACPLE